LAYLNLYDSSIAVTAHFLAAPMSSIAFSFSTFCAVVASVADASLSLVTFSTSLECSPVLLSSPSACFSSWDDFQKVLVALTKELSKNFYY